MMTRNQSNDSAQLEMLTINQLVPEEHLVRKLESAMDFSFINPTVRKVKIIKTLYNVIFGKLT